MTKHIVSIITINLVVLTSTLGILPAIVTAASASPTTTTPQDGQALEIAPPVITLDAAPGQTVTSQIYLRDITKTDLLVGGEANDFIAGDENGTPKILLNDTSANPYSLKSWIGPLPQLRLVPREIKSLNFTITVPTNASPGGHYGVVRFTATPPDLQSTGVSLRASLGALILVTVSGKITENVTLNNITVSQNDQTKTLFEAAPIQFTETFTNSGNVHEQPSGKVFITDMLGKEVASLGMNEPPRNILPSSVRKFNQSLDGSNIGNRFLFGRYTATVKAQYGTGSKNLTGSIYFWIIPYRAIAIGTITLVVLFFVLRITIRRYNHYIISQSQHSRRR